MTAVGIDLGTTFSAIAYVDPESGLPQIIPNDLGLPTTPSVVCVTDAEILLGAPAKEQQAAGTPAAAFFKRQMGVEGWTFYAGNRDYSAIDLSALILQKLKQDAERALSTPVTQAVITVPAYFKNQQREATIAAGRAAGLNVLQIVNEPTAAAIAYGRRHNVSPRLSLVYDLGGGTFDVTLLRVGADEIRVVSSEGDHELGGKDWDDRIVEFVSRQFIDEFGLDPLGTRESVGDLLVRVEEAKRRLSAANTTRVSIVHEGHRGSYELTRALFEDLTRDLMERTASLTRRVLADQELTFTDLDGVLLVGGSTRMPMVHDFVTSSFGKPPLSGVNVDEAVALGAAVMAGELAAPAAGRTFSLGSRRVVDVTNHSLGMIAINELGSAYINSIILPRHRPLPCVELRPYQHRSRRSGPIEIYMTQGESQLPADVSYLGRYIVHDVPAQPAGVTVIDISYSYDASGTVQVAAQVQSTGAPLSITAESLPADVPDRFLLPPKAAARPEHVVAYLAFDLSGSMSGEPLISAQQAAQGFLRNTDLAHASLGIVAFSDSTSIKLTASQSAVDIERSITTLRVGETGYGNEAHPFDELAKLLRPVHGRRFIVVLADGVWSCQREAINSAQSCHAQGIEVIAVGFGGADENFLRQIASSSEESYFTSLHGLVETFCSIAQVITQSGELSERPAAGTTKRLSLRRH